ncbi:thioredoxin domain-containing protein 17-like isoform X3 [Hyposmocoma kahamanoa]|uniref:thioredoxin domain-containing protein 17-like isoform X3 n=1 Tax=Hyposmocoma kahamanoa TaxID=1477025 RepID=UPI000E6D95AE|nr:thioredoxin domain-containing protein 17-like isoform X3 [Hyposmocoma kahamanoa]
MVRQGIKPKLIELATYEEFNDYVEKLPPQTSNCYFYFAGKKKENGRSWCIYCQLAEPVVKNVLNGIHKHVVFVFVDVGDREYWKNPQCPFRTDTRTKLMVIPTIIKWNGVQRLEGSQCNKAQLIEMMFEDE